MKFYIRIILVICTICIPTLIFANNLPIEVQTYINQLEEKNELFKEAIDSFGASSKEEAIKLYAEGVKSRSGPLQYSVMCKELKVKFENEMNKDKNYSWVTGTSSPWVNKYEILKYKYINKDTYSVIVKFVLNDAKGIIGESYTELEVKKINRIWCISNIRNL